MTCPLVPIATRKSNVIKFLDTKASSLELSLRTCTDLLMDALLKLLWETKLLVEQILPLTSATSLPTKKTSLIKKNFSMLVRTNKLNKRLLK